MDYTIEDGRVGELPVKAVVVDGATLNLQVETVEATTVANGRQLDLSLKVRVVRIDEAGNRIDEGPVVMQTVAGESDLRLQAELDNLVARAIGLYVRALTMHQAAASVPTQLVGASVKRVALETMALNPVALDSSTPVKQVK